MTVPAQLRIVVVAFSAEGHFNSIVAVLRELARRHHRVMVVSTDEDVSSRVARVAPAIACRALGDGVPSPPPGDLLAKLTRPAFARKFTEFSLLGPVPRQVERLREIVRAFRPDVIVANSVAYAAGIVGELEAVPWVCVSPHLIPLCPKEFTDFPAARTWTSLAGLRREMFQRFGVDHIRFKISDMISPWLNTVYATPELISRAEAENDFSCSVGSAVSPVQPDDASFPWQRLEEAARPIVYLAFGSQISPPPAVIERIVTALPSRQVTFVLSAKHLLDDPSTKSMLPPNVIAVRYAPQLAVLERATACVFHGGANSAMECFHAGKPMLVLPYLYDQPLTAYLIQRACAGFWLDPERADDGELTNMLGSLLDSGSSQTAQAQRIGASYRRGGGAPRIADLVEQVARERAAVVPN